MRALDRKEPRHCIGNSNNRLVANSLKKIVLLLSALPMRLAEHILLENTLGFPPDVRSLGRRSLYPHHRGKL